MRTSDVDIIMVPGWTNSGPDHWQTRWQGRLKTATRISGVDFDRPVLAEWIDAIIRQVEQATRPAILVAHSCGVSAVAHAAAKLPDNKVSGAFLVAPVDLQQHQPLDELIAASGSTIAKPVGFEPLPSDPLPFPSLLIASRDDAYCDYDVAGQMALSWGSALIDAGNVGHLNVASGHGPWPEGALRLGMFLRQLGTEAAS